MSTPSFSPGHVFKGTYRVERLLGSGGMGVVYEVTHLRVQRRFALKVLNPGCSPDPAILARFRREAEVTGHIRHPNIVGVVDFDCTPDGTHFLVLELLEGRTLERVLAHEVALTLEQVAAIVEQVASALEAAHGAGVIHRDLKPENIMLCREGGREVAKVLDFGLSKLLGATTVLTQTAVIFGTPQYMSPEQALEASAVDERSDIFSLGAIVYHMLSGRPPFHGSAVPSVLFKVVYEEPESLGSLRPDLPAPVIEVVDRALRKKPEERFSSAAELAQALSAAVARAAEGQGAATEVALEGAPTMRLSKQGLGFPPLSPEILVLILDPPSPDARLRDTDKMEAQDGGDESATRGGEGVVETVASPVSAPAADGPASRAPQSRRPGLISSIPPRATSPWATWWMGVLLGTGVLLSAIAVWLAFPTRGTEVVAAPPVQARGPEVGPPPRIAGGAPAPDARARPSALDAAIPGPPIAAPHVFRPLLPGEKRQPKRTSHGPRPGSVDHEPAPSPGPAPETRTAELRVSVSDEKDRSLAATVLVDGKPYRCCPLEGLPPLTVGQTYALEVRCDSYQRATARIRIGDGQNQRHFALHPLARRSAP
jgi:serine/threonine-protein kinase